jgi:adenine phosphoribosyltransferase
MTIESRLQERFRVVEDFPKKGISFKDISPVFIDPVLVREMIEAMSEPWKGKGITRVLGIESRGFLVGPSIALALDAGFLMVRKKGKLPPDTIEKSYSLEYGEAIIEMGKNDIKSSDRVLIHDDLLATGGTAGAAAHLVKSIGATLVGFSFISSLSFLPGKEALSQFDCPIHSIVEF